jgi:hypothetical protein
MRDLLASRKDTHTGSTYYRVTSRDERVFRTKYHSCILVVNHACIHSQDASKSQEHDDRNCSIDAKRVHAD